jgi:hypothetical protein
MVLSVFLISFSLALMMPVTPALAVLKASFFLVASLTVSHALFFRLVWYFWRNGSRPPPLNANLIATPPLPRSEIFILGLAFHPPELFTSVSVFTTSGNLHLTQYLLLLNGTSTRV